MAKRLMADWEGNLDRESVECPGRPALRLAYFAVFSLLGIYSLYWLMSLTHHAYGADYRIYLDAYTNARAGLDPYLPFDIGRSSVNHPIGLLLVRLLFVQNATLSWLIWSWASICAWLACFLIASNVCRPGSSSPVSSQPHILYTIVLFAILMQFGPFLETSDTGQVNTFALLFALAALLLSEANREGSAGSHMESQFFSRPPLGLS